MPDGFLVQLTGKEDLVAAFRQFRNELPKDPTRKPVGKAARFLSEAIRVQAPIGRTGKLRAAISTRVTRSKGATHGKINIGGGGWYWRFLEYGWHARGTGTFHRFEFIRPTARSLQAQTGQLLLNECEKEIAKVMDRIFRRGQRAAKAGYEAGFGPSFPRGF